VQFAVLRAQGLPLLVAACAPSVLDVLEGARRRVQHVLAVPNAAAVPDAQDVAIAVVARAAAGGVASNVAADAAGGPAVVGAARVPGAAMVVRGVPRTVWGC
jgi:hypothetical protein